MKTKVIQIPEGMELVETEYGFKFVKEKKKYPESWEELGTVKGYFVEDDSLILPASLHEAIESHQNVFPTKDQAQASLALSQLMQLRDRYRDGWVPDWDGMQWKYCIELFQNYWRTTKITRTHKSFSFETSEQRDHFLEHHIDLLNQVKPLFS